MMIVVSDASMTSALADNGIHVPADSDLHDVAQLEGGRIAISRFRSGSHLMAFVQADRRGWALTDDGLAAVAPLMGLLGTVIGMIRVFTAITVVGVGDPAQLAGGISEALITTAAGLTVAIPSLIFHRHLKRKIDELVVAMEQEAMKLVEFLHGERKQLA